MCFNFCVLCACVLVWVSMSVHSCVSAFGGQRSIPNVFLVCSIVHVKAGSLAEPSTHHSY